jgi:putative transposase
MNGRILMKQKRFKQEQIIQILKEAECQASTVVELCRRHGVSEQTFYRWRNKYGGMSVSEARRLKELEKENIRLKRLLAERDVEIDVMKEVLEKNW